ncbi:eCIS core domain-containing protein [Chitinimonas taiwanensis]|uniref:eCIS core domain-containing protein n=1 Tax=Chitinimonas taiwanensis TaxID=240412 RepID=UPI0035AEBF9C
MGSQVASEAKKPAGKAGGASQPAAAKGGSDKAAGPAGKADAKSADQAGAKAGGAGAKAADAKAGAAKGAEAQPGAQGPAAKSEGAQRFDRMAVRAKLSVSEPGDAVEREADAVADKVMRMSEPSGKPAATSSTAPQLNRAPAAPDTAAGGAKPASAPAGGAAAAAGDKATAPAAGKTPQAPKPTSTGGTTGGRATQENAAPDIRRAAASDSKADAPSVPADFASKLGEGQALDPNTRSFFEQRLGHDLADVRIHHDAQADSAAKQIHARAFTYGRHIAFAAGQFQPGSREGKQLLAHELAHVLQQRQDVVPRQIMRKPAAAGSVDVKGVAIPGFKAQHYSGKEFTRPAGYNRKEEGSKQISTWRKATKGARDNFAKDLGLNEAGIYVAVPKSSKLDADNKEVLVGPPKEIGEIARKPRWDESGKGESYDVDHIIELQIGGPDQDVESNLELRDASSNRSSGSSIDASITGILKKMSDKEGGDPEKIKAKYDLKYSDFAAGAAGGKSSCWSIKQINDQEPAKKGLNIYDPDLAAPSGSALPWPAGVDKEPFFGGPDLFVLYPSKSGGAPKQIKLDASGKPKDKSILNADWIKGVKLSSFDLNMSGGAENAGSLKAQIDISQLQNPNGGNEIDLTIKRLPGNGASLKQAGYINVIGAAGKIAKAFALKEMSPIDIVEFDILPSGLFIQGVVNPSLGLFQGTTLDLIVEGTDLRVQKTFTGDEIKLPGPFSITSSSLTVALGTKSGFSATGIVFFLIKGLGEGSLKATGKMASFAIRGDFEFDKKLFDAQAKLSLSYVKEGEAGKFSGEADLKIGKDKIKGIKSATVNAKVENETFTAVGKAETDIPGIKSLGLAIDLKNPEHFSVQGDGELEKLPGIQSGTLTMKLERNGENWSISGAGDITPAIPGVSSNIKGTYKDGIVLLKGQVGFKFGAGDRLKGDITIGVTNGTVDEAGNVSGEGGKSFKAFGKGDLTLKISDGISGTVSLVLKEDGSVEIGGSVTVADRELFPQIPAGDKAKHNLLTIKTPEIPLCGITVAGVGVAIVFYATGSVDAEASVGPGKLKNTSLTIAPFNPANISIDTLKLSGNADFEVPAKAGIALTATANISAKALVAELGGAIGITAEAGIPADPPLVKANAKFSWSQAEGFDLESSAALNFQPQLKFSLSGEVFAKLNVVVDTITVWSRKWELGSASFKLPLSVTASAKLGYNSKTGLRFDPAKDISIPKPELSSDDFLKLLNNEPATETVQNEPKGDGRTVPPAEVSAPGATPEGGDTPVQRKVDEAARPLGGTEPASSVGEADLAALGPGQALDRSSRMRFESQLKTRLPDVALHTGPAADQLARRLQAKAFTVGRHIVFAEGAYAPDSPSGQRLLAHELAHVQQQAGGVARQLMRGDESSESGAASPAAPAASPSVVGGTAEAPEITVPSVSLPAFKADSATPDNARRQALYTAKKNSGDPASKLFRPRNYTRTVHNQSSVWMSNTDASGAQGKIISHLGSAPADAPYLIRPKHREGDGIDMSLGTPAELATTFRRPLWNKQGQTRAFHVDHVVELQLNGTNDIANMELLEAGANTSSGGSVRAGIIAAIDAWLLEHGEQLPEDERSAEAIKRKYQVNFSDFSASGEPATADAWSKEEIDRGDHIDFEHCIDIYSPSQPSGGGVFAPWPAGERLLGDANEIVIYGASVGRPKPFSWPLGAGSHSKTVTEAGERNWIGGFKIESVQFDAGGSGQQAGALRGELFKDNPQLNFNGVRVEIPLDRKNGLPYAGMINKASIQGQISAIFSSAGVKGCSPVSVGDLDIDPVHGFVMRGQIHPSLSMIENANIDLIMEGDDLRAEKTFAGGDLALGGPFRILDSDLTLSIGTRSGLRLRGGSNFEIRRLGRGRLEAEAGMRGDFSVAGSFNFDRSLFGADAGIQLRYERNDAAPEGKLSGSGTVRIGTDKIRGVRSATIRASFDGAQREIRGDAELDIPGIESASLRVGFNGSEECTIEGNARFRDRPGIRNGQLAVTLNREGEDWHMAATGGAEASFAGITSTLAASYDDGLFQFSANAPFEQGPLSGTVLLGVTNGAVDEEGNVSPGTDNSALRPFGNGTLTARLTDWLQGGVGIKVRPSGDLLISGSIGIPNQIEVFGQSPPPERARRELFRLPTMSIPLVGIAVGGNTVGLALTLGGRINGYAHIGPGSLTQAELRIEDYNPAQPESLRVAGDARFSLPGVAGVEASFDAGVSLGAAVIRATAGLNATAGAEVRAEVSPAVNLEWTPAAGLHLHADLSASLNPQLRFSLNGYAEVVADAFVTSFTLWRKDWNLAERSVGSSLALGLNVPVDYYSDGRGVVFDPEQVSFQVPELNADTFAQLLNEGGSERSERAPADEAGERRAA